MRTRTLLSLLLLSLICSSSAEARSLKLIHGAPSLNIRSGITMPPLPELPRVEAPTNIGPEKRDEMIKSIAWTAGVATGFAIGLPVFFDGLSLTILGAGGAAWFTPGVLVMFRGTPDSQTLAAGIVGLIIGGSLITVAAILIKPMLNQWDTYKQTASRPHRPRLAMEPGGLVLRF